MTKVTRCFTLFLILVSAFPIFAQQDDKLLLPSEESASSFYSLTPDSDDVKLFLSGSWKADVSVSGGFGFTPGSGLDTSVGYSGISNGFSFHQSPDITVSLLLLEKILFETAFTDEFEDSTFRLGYIGDDKEFVRLVSAGNMKINLTEDTGSSDFFYIPGGDASSFGIHSLFAGPFSEHELLLRFDPQEELSKLYIGSDLLVEIEKEPADYLHGRMFYIPGAPADAVFYAEYSRTDSEESFDGSDRYLKRLEAEAYSYSGSSGRLLLENKPGGAVLVYSASTDWIAAGEPAEAVQATSAGDMLQLWEPGLFSDYEAAAVYDLGSVLPGDAWKTRAFLADDAATASSGSELNTEIFSDKGLVIILPYAGGTAQYPLSGPGVLTEPEAVYGPDAPGISAGSADKIIFRVRETASSYSADDPVPGTIRVFINGAETRAWSESGGTITFEVPPADNDRIEITYRKNTGAAGGDLLFATANRFFISNNWLAELNGGVRWNISQGYALPGEETSAFGGVSAGIKYDNSDSDSSFHIDAGITGGFKLVIENSTGNLLLRNMSGDSLNIALNRNTVFPSSVSVPLNLSKDDRGILLYKDYRTESGIAGYLLQDYTTPIAEDMIFSPEDSAAADRFKAGPYTASAQSDDRNSEILVMDYSLGDADSWVGVQIPLNGSSSIDLSGSTAVSLDYKSESNLSGIELNLEIGSIAEDLDDDDILDAETSEYGPGFVFDDPNATAGTLIGGDNLTGSNGRLDTEDINSNGFLDADETGAIVLFENISKPESDWKRLRLYLSDIERRRLKDAEFIRITVVSTAAGQQSGKILFDDIRIEGASFTASDDNGFTPPDFSEVSETLLPAKETSATFIESPTVDSGTSNDTLRIKWDSDWKIYSYIPPVAPADYAGLTFFYRCPVLTASAGEEAVLNFSISDSSGLGYKAKLPISTGTDWHEVNLQFPVNGRTGSVIVDGVESSDSEITFDAEASDLSLIELYTEGTDSGIIHIDEIFLTDPILKAVTGINEHLELIYDDSLLSAGNFEIIGPIKFSQTASVLVDADAEEIFNDSADFNLDSELALKIAGAPVTAGFSVSGPANLRLAGGHRIEIPIEAAGLKLIDEYKVSNDAANDFTKSNSLDFNLWVLSAEAGFSAGLDAGQLLRDWSGSIKTDNDYFNLGLSADFLLSDLNHTINRPDYFTGWYSGTILAGDFSCAVLQQRKTTFGLTAALPYEPVGFSTATELTADIDEDGLLSNSAEISFELPISFKIGSDTIKLSFAYNRFADFSNTAASSGFAADIPLLLSTLSTGGYLYSSIPYYEIFNDVLPQTLYDSCSAGGIDSAEFTNEASFSLSRNYSSRLIDLLLPYSFETAIKREIIKDFSDIEDMVVWDGIWRSAAINLFGAAGVFPFFDFYFSDELNWSLETSIHEPFTADITAEILFNTGFSIFGHKEDIFSIDLSAYSPISLDEASDYVKTELMYVWLVFPEKPLEIPLIPIPEGTMQIISNEEKLSLNFDDVFSMEIKHTTSLQFPGSLTLSIFGLAGYEYDNLEDNKMSLFGFSLGISGSIIY